jgi:hypothetical protein
VSRQGETLAGDGNGRTQLAQAQLSVRIVEIAIGAVKYAGAQKSDPLKEEIFDFQRRLHGLRLFILIRGMATG